MDDIILLINKIENENYKIYLYKKIKITLFVNKLMNICKNIYNNDDYEIKLLNFLYNYCIIIIMKDILNYYTTSASALVFLFK